jgi:hypothetical protein
MASKATIGDLRETKRALSLEIVKRSEAGTKRDEPLEPVPW